MEEGEFIKFSFLAQKLVQCLCILGIIIDNKTVWDSI